MNLAFCKRQDISEEMCTIQEGGFQLSRSAILHFDKNEQNLKKRYVERVLLYFPIYLDKFRP